MHLLKSCSSLLPTEFQQEAGSEVTLQRLLGDSFGHRKKVNVSAIICLLFPISICFHYSEKLIAQYIFLGEFEKEQILANSFTD